MALKRDEIRIRPATAEDARAITELAEELGYPNEIEAIRTRIQAIGETDVLLVALNGEETVVGFIQAHQVCIIEVGFRVEIVGLVVSSKQRRSGVGRHLLSEVERWAAGLGAPVVSVRSNTKRMEAHLFILRPDITRSKRRPFTKKRRHYRAKLSVDKSSMVPRHLLLLQKQADSRFVVSVTGSSSSSW